MYRESFVCFVLPAYKPLPFRQEKQKINAAVAAVAEGSHPKEKILCGLRTVCVKAFASRIFRTVYFVVCSSVAPINPLTPGSGPFCRGGCIGLFADLDLVRGDF
jgi:hypothetical protein